MECEETDKNYEKVIRKKRVSFQRKPNILKKKNIRIGQCPKKPNDDEFICKASQVTLKVPETECPFLKTVPKVPESFSIPIPDIQHKLVHNPRIVNVLPPIEEQVAKRETIMQKFDRDVTTELLRRQDSESVILDPETSDSDLLAAVDMLSRAKTQYTFEETVKAAEEAARFVPADKKEEAALEGARGFQAELIDVINKPIPGIKPIQVIGYIGITRPSDILKFK